MDLYDLPREDLDRMASGATARSTAAILAYVLLVAALLAVAFAR